MKNPGIHIFQSAENLVDGFTASFITEIEFAKRSANPVHIALSGGNTPKLFFQKLADKTHEVDWAFVRFYWGDERCVPPEDEQSNYRMTQDFLLSKIDIPASNIHRLRGENDPVDEADRYAKELLTYLPEKSIDKPVFDWIILGIGEDGHTASIFPNMKPEYSNEVCLVATHPQTGQKRVSLTMPVLNAAKRVSFLVSGNGKAHIVSDILNKRKPELPAAQVIPGNGVEWFLDAEAAALL